MAIVTTHYLPTCDTGNAVNPLLGINNGETAVWDEILHRYGKLVTTTVRSFRLQEADANDAIQMTWMRLVENTHQLRCPQQLSSWLVTTARRECLHIVHQAKHRAHLTNIAPETAADPSPGPEQHAIDAHTAHTLHTLIEELSPLRRTLIRMLFIEDPRSYSEITRITGIPPGGIGPTRARALQQLRDKLDKHEIRPEA